MKVFYDEYLGIACVAEDSTDAHQMMRQAYGEGLSLIRLRELDTEHARVFLNCKPEDHNCWDTIDESEKETNAPNNCKSCGRKDGSPDKTPGIETNLPATVSERPQPQITEIHGCETGC